MAVAPHKLDQRYVDLVLGLDFGTSFTKIVIRTPYLGGQRAVAVPFRHADGISQYLLPSAVTVHPDSQTVELGLNAHDSTWGIKELLRRKPTDRRALAFVVGYLSRVIRCARIWFLQSQAPVITDLVPRWAMNLGIPSAGYDDRQIQQAFLSAARAAWFLADEPRISFDECSTAVDLVADSTLDAAISVKPEFAAEMVGFSRSEYRQEGLYFLVDVGASTLDICGFRLNSRDGDDEYNILTALVTLNGAAQLHKKRVRAFQRAGIPVQPALQKARFGELPAVPNTCDQYLKDGLQVPQNVWLVEEEFLESCKEDIVKVLLPVRKKRDPYATEWESGAPVFLCGGGSAVSLFEEALNRARDRLTSMTTIAAPVIRRLPRPQNLDSPVPPDDFHRLAIAYGLSFPEFDIGEVCRPSEIPDVEPQLAKCWRDRYIDKEMV